MKKQAESNLKTGFTLLEILLTATVLLIGLTAVFQTTRASLQRMVAAKELTEAQNACQVLLNEMLAQSAPMRPGEGITLEHLPDWQVRVDIYPASQAGIYVLHLSAHRHGDVKYQLLRWVPAERVQVPLPADNGSVGNEFDDLFRPL